jgi:hypothetical protein
VQPISEPITRLPYMKLQYPTYVKDINLDAHIKVFKKAIKTNGEIMEVDISNLFGFTLTIISMNGEKNMFETIQTALLKSWKRFRTMNNDEEVYMQL